MKVEAKIEVTIGETKHVLSRDEALALLAELKKAVGDRGLSYPPGVREFNPLDIIGPVTRPDAPPRRGFVTTSDKESVSVSVIPRREIMGTREYIDESTRALTPSQIERMFVANPVSGDTIR